MTVDQAINYLRSKSFIVLDDFFKHEVRMPDGSKTWSSLSDRELIMLAEGIRWAAS